MENPTGRGKTAIVLGATGAMGSFLVPRLADRGFRVTGVTLDEAVSHDERIEYVRTNALDIGELKRLFSRGYDVAVDFMWYGPGDFDARSEILLGGTDRYVLLSSYRVYDDDEVVRETTPRLFDSRPNALPETNYAIVKAKEENVLFARREKNWTIVRPVCVCSPSRLPLVNYAGTVPLMRAREGKPLVLPMPAKDRRAAVIYGGDAAEMIARLVCTDKARGEAYTLCASDSLTWGETAALYGELCGLKTVWVGGKTAEDIAGGDENTVNLLRFDRYFDRRMDNGKVLGATGLTAADLMSVREWTELCIRQSVARGDESALAAFARMDAYLAGIGVLG